MTDEFVQKPYGTFDYYIGSFFDAVSRPGVPLFIMISGALLLDENYELTLDKLKKRIGRYVIFYLFWSAIYVMVYYFIIPVFNHGSISIIDLIGKTINGHYHLWFIPMIVGLSLIAPIIRLFVRIRNIKYVQYFLIISFIFTYIIPFILTIGSTFSPLFNRIYIFDYLYLKIAGGFLPYFVLGWYLNNCKIDKSFVLLCGIAGILVTILGPIVLSAYIGEPSYAMFYDYASPNVVSFAALIFYLFKNKKIEINYLNSFGARLMCFISRHSLGVYAVHVFFIDFTTLLFKDIISNCLLRLVVSYLLSVILSLGMATILKKVPVLKRLV